MMFSLREQFESSSSGDWADIAGAGPSFQDDISSEILEYEDRKVQLQTIIDELAREAPSWDAEPVTVDVNVVATAQRFLRALPTNRELPQVAPDGEGDLLFVWETPHGNCILTVQNDVLHLVDNPGTQYAEHIDAQQFVGRRIPVSILHAIPTR
jgi:hypothetical protein